MGLQRVGPDSVTKEDRKTDRKTDQLARGKSDMITRKQPRFSKQSQDQAPCISFLSFFLSTWWLTVLVRWNLNSLIWYLFYLFIYWLNCVTCGVLVPRPGSESTPLAMKVQSLNPWSAREFPFFFFFPFHFSPFSLFSLFFLSSFLLPSLSLFFLSLFLSFFLSLMRKTTKIMYLDPRIKKKENFYFPSGHPAICLGTGCAVCFLYLPFSPTSHPWSPLTALMRCFADDRVSIHWLQLEMEIGWGEGWQRQQCRGEGVWDNRQEWEPIGVKNTKWRPWATCQLPHLGAGLCPGLSSDLSECLGGALWSASEGGPEVTFRPLPVSVPYRSWTISQHSQQP